MRYLTARRLFALALTCVALAGCSVSSTTNLDPHFEKCINAGGSYKDNGSGGGDGWSCTFAQGHPMTARCLPRTAPDAATHREPSEHTRQAKEQAR